MTTTQREILAYGDPSYGGWALGGANAHRFTLLSWAASEDLETRTIRATLAVHDTGAADREGQFQLTRNWLEVTRGNLGITVGVDRTITVNGAFVSGTRRLTLTRTAGDSFVEEDVGLPVTVAGVSFPISVFTDTDTVVAVLPPGVTPPAISAASLTIGLPLIRCADVDGDGDAIKVGGVGGRTTVSRTADPDDDATRRVFELVVAYELPAAEVRTGADFLHRRTSSITRVTNSAGLVGSLTFSGTVTSGVDSGVGKSASAILSTAVDAWALATAALIVPGATLELDPAAPDVWDDEDNILTFQRTFREINFPDTAAAANDPRITGAQVVVGRSYQNVHGIAGGRAPFQVQVNYSAGITAKGVNAVTYRNLPDLWKRTIKPHLVSEVQAFFGGTPVIIGGTDPVIDPVSSTIQASLVVMIEGSGSNVYSYSRTTSMDLDEQLEADPLYDGKDHTYVLFSAGQALTGAVQVQVVQVGEPTRLRRGGRGGGNALADLSGLGGGGLFFSGGALSISLPSPGVFGLGGGGGDSDNANNSPNSYEVFPNPGEPSRFYAAAGVSIAGGKWVPTRRRASESPSFWGQDPDDLGSRVQVTTTTYISEYLYVKEGTISDPPIARETTGGGSGSRSRTTTRERGV
jgi:hypothetical protein